MGCGCNKVRTYSESNPLVFGEEDGEAPVNVRATVTVMGLKVNSEFWASGTGLAAMLDAGWLVPV